MKLKYVIGILMFAAVFSFVQASSAVSSAYRGIIEECLEGCDWEEFREYL